MGTLGPPSPPPKREGGPNIAIVTAPTNAFVRSLRATHHIPRAKADVAAGNAYVMAKQCHHMADRIGRGALEGATDDAYRQLRDYVDELRFALDAARDRASDRPADAPTP